MTENQQTRELTRQIAAYVELNGDEETETQFILKRTLDDGRILTIDYHSNGSGPTTPDSNSSLEIKLEPVRVDQIGYKLTDWGLRGGYGLFEILTGSGGVLTIARDTFTDCMVEEDHTHPPNRYNYVQHIQGLYDAIIREIHQLLIKQAS